MPVETMSRPDTDKDEQKIDMSKYKTQWEKNEEEKIRRECKRCEEILRGEGMPPELDPEISDADDDPVSAAIQHARERALKGRLDYDEGEHDKFAYELASRYHISVEKAQQIVEDAANFEKRRYKRAA